MSLINILHFHILIFITAILITACGGGGGGGTDDQVMQQKVHLYWTAPTTRTDGTPLLLSEMGGYKIYMGTSPDNLLLKEEIIGAHETEIFISDLPQGVYYFAVTTFDIDGQEGGFSQIVSKEVG